jgi:PAS domain S-box-containing protein
MQLMVYAAVVVIEAIAIVLLVMDNRIRQVRLKLSKTHSLERLLLGFSTRLTCSRPDQLGSLVEDGIAQVMKIIGAGRVCWYVKPQNSTNLERVYSVHKPDFGNSPQSVSRDDIPYIFERLMRDEPLVMHSPESLPPEAETDRQFFKAGSIRGLILIPSDCGTERKGVLGVAYIPEEIMWTEDLVPQLSVLNNLIVNTVERKIVNDLLHESEKRFRCLFESAPIGITLSDVQGNLLFGNPAFCSMLHYSPTELRGMHCNQYFDPEDDYDDDIELFDQLRHGIISRLSSQRRFVRKDGKHIWGRIDIALIHDESGGTPYLLGMVEDITQRKLAEQELMKTRSELEQLAGYLIRSQDEERHRISRELHDDIGQRLSLLAVEFDLLSQSLMTEGHRIEGGQVAAIKQQADDLTSDVHQLSHQLHSAKLQHLGLHSAVEELARQISKHNQISIKLNTGPQDILLPPDVALCFFRVTQEALNNVIRHSKASSVSVDVGVGSGMARLEIGDNGVGFDVSESEGGLGMLSMRERLRTLGGLFTVNSRRGEGTIITAAVPLKQVENVESQLSDSAA